MAITAANLADRAAYELKDTGHTNWSEAELIVYINEAVRHVVKRIAAMWPDAWPRFGENYEDTQNIVADTANYDLPSDFYMMLRVKLTDSDGDTSLLEPISLEREDDSDEDDGYLLLNDDIYLYPTPDTSVTSGLTLWYISLPPEAGSTDSVPLSTWFEDSIKEYVVVKAKARQEEKTGDFGAFYRMVERDMEPFIAKMNASEDEVGVNVLWRQWI